MATPPTFTVGQVLTAAQMNAVGMWKVAETSFSNSSGVEIQNCFSSDYRNYLMKLTFYGNNNHNLQMQYMSGTNTIDSTSTYDRWGYLWITSIVNFNALNQPSNFLGNYFSAAQNFSTAEVSIYQPNVAGVYTTSHTTGWSGDSGLAIYFDNQKKATTQYTGIYLFPGPGTASTISGTATVYGLR